MPASAPSYASLTLGEVIRQRLPAVKRSSEELAQAIDVPIEYVNDLIAGRRRAPDPERTDLYPRMTAFLRVGRNDLVNCARAERATQAPTAANPDPVIRRQLLALCEPDTARTLQRRRSRGSNAMLADLLQRVLEVAQSAARRLLEDRTGLRIAALRRGETYASRRVSVLEFLDASLDTLTPEALREFITPRIALWDVDLETGVLRVVLRSQEPQERSRRRPLTRGARAASA